ncbi:MAG: hypothetical protein ACP5E2_15655 [Terracidiphilus sp.]
MDFDVTSILQEEDVLNTVIGIRLRNPITSETTNCFVACRPYRERVQCIIVHSMAPNSPFPDVIPELTQHVAVELEVYGYYSSIYMVDAEVYRDLFYPRRYEIHNVTMDFSGDSVLAVMSDVSVSEFDDIAALLDPIVWLAQQLNLI